MLGGDALYLQGELELVLGAPAGQAQRCANVIEANSSGSEFRSAGESASPGGQCATSTMSANEAAS